MPPCPRADARDALVFRKTQGKQEAGASELRGDEFGGSQSEAKRVFAEARRYAFENLIGKWFVNQETGRQWLISRRGVEHTLWTTKNPMVARSIKVLPGLIQNAHFEFSEADKRGRPFIHSVDTYVAPLMIGGEKYDAVIKVLRLSSGAPDQIQTIDIYHHHRVKERGATSPKALGRQGDLPPIGSDASTNIIGAPTGEVKAIAEESGCCSPYDGGGLDSLPPGAVVGTSSPRRRRRSGCGVRMSRWCPFAETWRHACGKSWTTRRLTPRCWRWRG